MKMIPQVLMLTLLAAAFPPAGSGAVQPMPLEPDMGIVEPRINCIQDPVFGMPAFWIRDNGNDATVLFDPTAYGKLPLGDDYSDWTVTLRKSRDEVFFDTVLDVESVEFLDPHYLLHVNVPLDLPEDLFDLSVSVISGKDYIFDTQPNAVKIIDHIRNHYKIVHITDVHFDDPRGYVGNLIETLEYKFIHKMMDVVNIVDPEFVILTGDIVFGILYTTEYPNAFEGLQSLDVPVFMSVGNHDAINHDWKFAIEKVDGLEAYEDVFAPLNYSVRYGGFEYISTYSIDWSKIDRWGIGMATLHWRGQMRESQLDWIEAAVAGSDAELLMVGMHHPPHLSFEGEGGPEFQALMRDYQVDAVLAGHTHYDDVTWDGDVQYLTTTSTLFDFQMPGYPGFRMLEVLDNEIVYYNYEDPHWSHPVYKNSYPGCKINKLHAPSVTCEFDPPNDGGHSTVTATLANHTHDTIFGASVEFYMPMPSPGYTYDVTGGRVVDVLDSTGIQIWYVKAVIGGNSAIEVTITRIPE